MLNTPFAPWPSYSEEEIDAVAKVLRSNKVNYWTGTEIRSFEAEFAQYVGVSHAIALANGSLALDAALKFLIQPGDEVVVTPRSFIASASSVVLAGGRPVFADVDPDSQNITVESISAVLTPRTRAIVVVHLAGIPADMDPIMALAESRGIKVIEDCAQAHGTLYKGRSVGSIGHVGAWSFCQDKTMTTGGEGGMITTNDKELWSSIWSFKDHGKSWDTVHKPNPAPGYRWLHEFVGTNWRMTEMQAAIGRIQLARLDSWRDRRLKIARRIWSTCEGVPWIRVAKQPAYADLSPYRAYVYVIPSQLPQRWSRDTILENLSLEGVPAFIGSCPEVYLEKAFENLDSTPSRRLPVAQSLGETSIAFLCHPSMTEDDISLTCCAIRTVISKVKTQLVA